MLQIKFILNQEKVGVKCCYLFVIYIRVKHERSKYLSTKRDLTDF